MESEYTNRELVMLIKSNSELNVEQHSEMMKIHHNFEQSIDKKLSDILTQTTKTNGRVNKLENARSYIAGGMALVSIVVLPLLWILITQVKENSVLAQRNSTIIEKTLSNN